MIGRSKINGRLHDIDPKRVIVRCWCIARKYKKKYKQTRLTSVNHKINKNVSKKIKRHTLENPHDFLLSKSEFFVLCIDYRILYLLI